MREKAKLDIDAVGILEEHLNHLAVEIEAVGTLLVRNAQLLQPSYRLFKIVPKEGDMI